MSPMDRRRFLAVTAATAASLKTFAQAPSQSATLTLHPGKSTFTIPRDFVGLSYEAEELMHPSFFSSHNSELVAQFRTLAPQGGILRVGGNTSDFGYWVPTEDAPIPQRRPAHAFGAVRIPDNPYPVTPEHVERLRGFLNATGWDCIYGINLATNVPSVAAEEAAAVTKILGEKLVCLQIGNEPDRYGINFRRDPKTWGAEPWFAEWLPFAKAVIARVPDVKLGLPDMSAKPDWFAVVVKGLDENPDVRARVTTLTYHYYIDGPASNPKMDIPHMLHANAGVVVDADVVRDAADKLHKTWRMSEGNTCWSGGKPGVSDVFAAALWSADYFLLHASLGCAGVNLHGGSGMSFGKPVTNGHLNLDPAFGAPNKESGHPRPAYTPLSHSSGQYVAEPVSYGMRLAGMFAGATLIPIDFNPGSINATAYAAKTPGGKILLAIINKDSSRAVNLELPAKHAAAVHTLTGESLTSRTADFHAASKIPATGSNLHIVVPPSTASVYTCEL
jgi:hypothetical protein